MSKAGEEILAGLKDAIKHANGDKSHGRSHEIENAPINKKVIQDKSNIQIAQKNKD